MLFRSTAFLEEPRSRPGRKDSQSARAGRSKGDGGHADAILLSQFLPSMEFLGRELATEIREDQVQLRLTSRGLVISLRQAAFFPSGQDVIAPETYVAIGKVAQTIGRLPNHVRLEGHTDSIPIHNERFRSNWQLSTARAISMLELLTDNFHLPAGKFTVAGYADTIPVDSNDSDDRRRRNRRVDIVVLNQLGLNDEPLGSQKAQDEVINRIAEESVAAP